MKSPKQYKAMTMIPETDPFAGGQSREVQGYYVKHITATPYPISTKQERDNFIDTHTKHYIMSDGFSDWGLSRELEMYEIDIDTLREIE